MKTLYDVLEVKPDASPEEIKQAFRQKIARYHPDKVQHLGAEFQALASTRAAELTEAYSILTNAQRRIEYDRKLRAVEEAGGAEPPSPSDESARPHPTPQPPIVRPPTRPQGPRPESGPAASGSRPPPPPPTDPRGTFVEERASRDELVRKASVARLRVAIQSQGAAFEVSPPSGFDVAAHNRVKGFLRTQKSRVLGRFVSRIDGSSISDTWMAAARVASADTQFAVFLMGIELAPPPELAEAIAQQRRRKLPGGPGSLVLIPVDVRDWSALVPTDTPGFAKSILSRLRSA